jgi:sterol desaturase/sphingolipid hydroxylase (fatty acid hydroxylase superfamily)
VNSALLHQYWFWLIVVSALCFVAERLFPWRKQQPWRRPLLAQDLFWLVFNGHFLALAFGWAFSPINDGQSRLFAAIGGVLPESLQILAGTPLWLQVVLLLVIKDFFEWVVHNLLHRVNLLWKIHRVHHSIRVMDWIGNFRFHWGEIFVYQTFKYLPLALLGASPLAVLFVGVFSTLIGHINHSNLDISYGPLRYVLNSPRLHIWHHDMFPDKPAGVNFAIVLSVWDWLFRTAYLPPDPPKQIGFEGDQDFPEVLWWRFLLPLWDVKGSGPEAPKEIA